MTVSSPLYADDLAHVHHAGFGGFVRAATPGVLATLREAGLRDGRVVELGCGDGTLLAALVDAGYDAWGLDVSDAFVQLARQIAPGAEVVLASATEAELPPCAAVLALGEVLCYLPGGVEDVARVLERAAGALAPGGLLLFDVLEHDPARPMRYRTWADGEGWAVLVDVHEDLGARRIERRIVTFRADDTGAWRRAEETHRVTAFAREELLGLLRGAGFRARAVDRWGEQPFAERRVGFVAERA